MTVATEMRAKKRTLENGIVDLIRGFERETGLSVSNVDISSHIEQHDYAVMTYKATVTATLR